MFEKKLAKLDKLYFSKIENSTTIKIRHFYNSKPFPNYKENENLSSLLSRGNNNLFIKYLKKHIGMGKKILEVGCGTITFQLLHFYFDGLLWKFSLKENRENILKYIFNIKKEQNN